MVLDKELSKNPNKYAANSSYSFDGDVISIGGYQKFEYNLKKKTLKLNKKDKRTIIKKKLVNQAFSIGSLKCKSVLDLGGNNGLYSLLSLINGAGKAEVVDIDKEAINNVKKLSKDANINQLSASLSNVLNVSQDRDIVIALALVHWIFDLTTGFGSLKSAIQFLRSLTKEALIVEWVDQEDPVIINYKHTSSTKNSEQILNYNEENFLNLLRENFDNLILLGSISTTRKLYLAFDKSFLVKRNLDWSKLIYPPENIVSSKALCKSPSGEFLYSRVYELDDKFVKQTNLLLGRNERNVLYSLNHPSIPKLLFYEEQLNYSVLEIEKMNGQTLSSIIKSCIKLSDRDINELAKQLFESLNYLHSQGIEHRDVTPNNVIWCKSSRKLSIIDFGWSHIKENEKIFTPPGLGKINGFCGFIDSQQIRSDNYAAAIIISLLIKDINLDEAEQIIADMIIKEINDKKSNLKLWLLSIMDLQNSSKNTKTYKKNKIHFFTKIKRLTLSEIIILFRKVFKRFPLLSKILRKILKIYKNIY